MQAAIEQHCKQGTVTYVLRESILFGRILLASNRLAEAKRMFAAASQLAERQRNSHAVAAIKASAQTLMRDYAAESS